MNTASTTLTTSPALATLVRGWRFPSSRQLAQVGILAGVCWFFFFHRLADRDLWSSHEARAAQNAQRMLDDRSFGLPRLFDDHYDFQKPPLYYWLVAGITFVRGGRVDALSERLPAALAAAGCVWLLWYWLRRRGRPVAALAAALALATMVHFTWLGRTGRIDMPLAFCVAAAVLSLPSRRWWWLGGAALAAGLLLKGPVGFVLPVAVVGGGCVFRRVQFSWRPCAGAALGLLLGVPWFVWANIETHGEFMQVFFWYHNVHRALGDAEALAVHPWWYYGPRLAVDALPWSLVLPAALITIVRRRAWRGDSELSWGLIWTGVVIGVLSCARFKRADYLLPAYPGLALALGCWFEYVWSDATWLSRRRLATAGAGILLFAAVSWAWWLHIELPRHEAAREQRTFARAIRRLAPAPQVVLFFRAEAHSLAFHLGQPVNTFLEWENLDVWAGRPGPHFIVMPPDSAAEWSQHVSSGTLELVARNTDLAGGHHEKPLLLFRTLPGAQTPCPTQPTNRPQPKRR